MSKKLWVVLMIVAAIFVAALAVPIPCVRGGEVNSASHYQVLEPIRHGNLTIFPVVTSTSHDTHAFLTLDEGLRSGDVIVSESGNVSPLVRPRRRDGVWREQRGDGAQVNRLVLVNNSKKPLLLLAGEIVTGGKQDRIIGKDRLVPAESDPIDLSVFCVEPGRWVGTSAKFAPPPPPAPGVMGGMVQPSVRSKAMGDKDQQRVWDEVAQARHGMSQAVTVDAAPAVAETSSYAGVIANREVRDKLEDVAAPVQQEYQSVIRQLRDRNAVGVVVAVNGEIIWADLFASTNLLEKYWPKLVRSYAAESMIERAKSSNANIKSAQEFLTRIEGRREVVESEPGLYRHTEISGDGFKVFELTSLLPGSGFDLHIAKMSD
jgi:ARG and Rhodanese-Phosphatase-superfamily-associated Protein domain